MTRVMTMGVIGVEMSEGVDRRRYERTVCSSSSLFSLC